VQCAGPTTSATRIRAGPCLGFETYQGANTFCNRRWVSRETMVFPGLSHRLLTICPPRDCTREWSTCNDEDTIDLASGEHRETKILRQVGDAGPIPGRLWLVIGVGGTIWIVNVRILIRGRTVRIGCCLGCRATASAYC
jgi:hypothetical protein